MERLQEVAQSEVVKISKNLRRKDMANSGPDTHVYEVLYNRESIRSLISALGEQGKLLQDAHGGGMQFPKRGYSVAASGEPNRVRLITKGNAENLRR